MQKCILVSAQIVVAQYYIYICKKVLGVHQFVLMVYFTSCKKMCIGFSIFKLVPQYLYVLIHMYDILIYISIAL